MDFLALILGLAGDEEGGGGFGGGGSEVGLDGGMSGVGFGFDDEDEAVLGVVLGEEGIDVVGELGVDVFDGDDDGCGWGIGFQLRKTAIPAWNALAELADVEPGGEGEDDPE